MADNKAAILTGHLPTKMKLIKIRPEK